MVVCGDSQTEITRAAAVVRDGGIIAFPTETYYGLGVDPFNERALATLFALKNRSVVKPVLVLIAAAAQLEILAEEIPVTARILMKAFWPGPLTIVFAARGSVPPALTGGTGTVGVRLSPHLIALRLLTAYGSPMTATSANISGQPAAETAEQVYTSFGEHIDVIVDGGRVPGKKGSTLVGVLDDSVQYIREGRIAYAVIQERLRQCADKS